MNPGARIVARDRAVGHPPHMAGAHSGRRGRPDRLGDVRPTARAQCLCPTPDHRAGRSPPPEKRRERRPRLARRSDCPSPHARRSHIPRRASTWRTVRSRISRSSHTDQLAPQVVDLDHAMHGYVRRAEDLPRPVMPGRTASRRRCQPSISASARCRPAAEATLEQVAVELETTRPACRNIGASTVPT